MVLVRFGRAPSSDECSEHTDIASLPAQDRGMPTQGPFVQISWTILRTTDVCMPEHLTKTWRHLVVNTGITRHDIYMVSNQALWGVEGKEGTESAPHDLLQPH